MQGRGQPAVVALLEGVEVPGDELAVLPGSNGQPELRAEQDGGQGGGVGVQADGGAEGGGQGRGPGGQEW